MIIAAAQLNSVDDINVNLEAIEKLIQEASQLSENERPQMIFFPENSLYLRINQDEKMPEIKLEDRAFERLQKLTDQTKIVLHLTTNLIVDGKNWNASVLIEPGKTPQVIYRKVHLFDIALANQKPIRESDVFQHGTEASMFEFGGLKFGSSICYDVRFSELYYRYAKAGADVLLIPAAFLKTTGEAHWDILLRARAIESQCYVIAPAQVGTHQSTRTSAKRETFGHSMVVDPWGTVISRKADGIGLIYSHIDISQNKKIRQQIPMSSHRRL